MSRGIKESHLVQLLKTGDLLREMQSDLTHHVGSGMTCKLYDAITKMADQLDDVTLFCEGVIAVEKFRNEVVK